MIKQNKLEDKLEKAIQEYRNNNNKQNSNKNNQESAADILYKDSKIKEEKEKKESEYKSKLLNILGDKATNADVLYGTTKELEEKIKELGLGDGLKRGLSAKATGQSRDSITNKYSRPTTVGKITSPYGERIHPVYKTKKFHDGIDVGVPIGTPVSSATDGIVKKAGWVNGYGNYVKIEYKNSNGDKIETFYAHLNDFKTKDGKILKEGQPVKQGEQIGHSGNTGIGTGAHLHIGARKNDKTINPIDIIGNVYFKK